MERIADVVCAVDADTRIVYLNPAAARFLGEPLEQFYGRSCLELVHPDDAERAIANFVYSTETDRVEVPTSFRIKTTYGWQPFDMRGHGLLTDPHRETTLMVLREAEGLEQLDALLEALAGGSSAQLVSTLIARQAIRMLWENQIAVLIWRGDDTPEVADTGLSAALRASLVAPTEGPWSEARRTRRLAGGLVADLPERLAEAAESAGFGAVWAIPVDDPLVSLDACLVSFGPASLGINLGYEHALQRCARLLRIAERQRHQFESLERTARSDPLTGIPNRRRLIHRFDELLADLDRDVVPCVSLVYIDLDDFKPVNDTFGHAAGDVVLRTLANRLADVAGRDGVAARLGGDEFAVVAPRPAEDLVERIRASCALPIALPGGQQVVVGTSLGVASAERGDDASRLLEAADRDCYRDKRSKGTRSA